MLNLLIWSDKSLQSQNWTARSRTRNRLTVAQLRGAPDIFGFWTMGLLDTTRYSDLEESPCTYNILQSYVIKTYKNIKVRFRMIQVFYGYFYGMLMYFELFQIFPDDHYVVTFEISHHVTEPQRLGTFQARGFVLCGVQVLLPDDISELYPHRILKASEEVAAGSIRSAWNLVWCKIRHEIS